MRTGGDVLTLDEISNRLNEPDLRLEVVAAETGLAYNTVRRYASGKVTDPPMDSVKRLSDWLQNYEGATP